MGWNEDKRDVICVGKGNAKLVPKSLLSFSPFRLVLVGKQWEKRNVLYNMCIPERAFQMPVLLVGGTWVQGSEGEASRVGGSPPASTACS